MQYTRTQVVFAFLAGSLLVNALMLLLFVGSYLAFAHHIFVLHGTWASNVAAAGVLLVPTVVGGMLLKYAFTEGKRLSGKAATALTILAMLFLIFGFYTVGGTMLGCFGIDFHWKG